MLVTIDDFHIVLMHHSIANIKKIPGILWYVKLGSDVLSAQITCTAVKRQIWDWRTVYCLQKLLILYIYIYIYIYIWLYCWKLTVCMCPRLFAIIDSNYGHEKQKKSFSHKLPEIQINSTLAWKIPWMENPGGLQSMGSQRVGRNWVTSLSLCFHVYHQYD